MNDTLHSDRRIDGHARPAPRYQTLERLRVPAPADRIDYIAQACRGRHVLDIGCFDETAQCKRDTEHWLHGRIATQAASVLGIDASPQIPPHGLRTAERAVIVRGDGLDIRRHLSAHPDVDIIVAGEFIEHLENPLEFMRTAHEAMPGGEILLSTPNGMSAANAMLGWIGAEAQHPDHLAVFSYKVLHTLCRRAGFAQWQIIPYRFFATEMKLQAGPALRCVAGAVEAGLRIVERIAPMRSFGYIVHARL